VAHIGGRLRRFWEKWERNGAAPWVVNVLRRGFKLMFWEQAPLTTTPISLPDRPSHSQVVQAETLSLLEKGAVEVVKDPSTPGFYSRLFVVPKPNGKWRPVIDLKALNHYVKVPKFKMESLQSIWSALLPGNYAFSLDLQDAYFHIPIHKSHRKFLRFVVKDQVYQFRALPFGLASAPWIFTQVMAQVKAMAHLKGIQLYLYFDDWLVQVAKFLLGSQQATFLLNLCSELGLVVNVEKSDLIPSQRFDFIGATFDLCLNLVLPKEENRVSMSLRIRNFLQSQFRTAQGWLCMLGSLNSQFRFVPFGHLYLRPLQWHLKRHWSQAQGSLKDMIPLSPEVRECLKWWIQQLSRPVGVPLVPQSADIHMFTDASERGWGAHVGSATYQGLWGLEESRLHINVLELRAVRLALTAHLPPAGSHILVATDNTTVKSYINRQGGTRSWSLMEETIHLFNLVIDKQWQIKARHIAGKLNVLADQLSRAGQVIQTEWTLNPQVVDLVFSRWGRPLIDLCATSLNSQCHLYVSPVPDPKALAVDVLSMDFQGLEAYVFPPHQILQKILQKFMTASSCRLIVIAPWWPQRPWFPTLKLLSVEPPVRLPQSPSLLRQPGSPIFHPNVATLNLHAWLLEK